IVSLPDSKQTTGNRFDGNRNRSGILMSQGSLLRADILHFDRPEFRAQLERRRASAGLGLAHHFPIDLVFDHLAGDDDLKRGPFAFLDALVLLVSRYDVEF